jgi:uncharacterized protein YjeT (DUF2065 family)
MMDSTTVTCHVDSDLLDELEQECYEIAYQQRLLYNERWYASSFFKKPTALLRLAGLVVSLFGVLVCLFYIFYPSSCPKWFFAEIYLLVFVLAGLLFYFMPRMEANVLPGLKNAGSSGCKRLARRIISRARPHVPFGAEYAIEGDSISYCRVKGDKRQQLWKRRLKGYAVIGKHATLFFRKPTSIQPTMLVMHDNNEVMQSILSGLVISYTKNY